jgi:hypothetical protein
MAAPSNTRAKHLPDDRGNEHFGNVGKHLPNHTVQQARREPPANNIYVDKNIRQFLKPGDQISVMNAIHAFS